MNKIGKREFTEQICFGHKNTMNFHVGVDILFCIGFGPFSFELGGYS